MTGEWKSAISRRLVLSGILGALGLVALGGIAFEASELSRQRYKPSPFDDLLAKLPDRDSASRLGAAVIAETPGFSATRAARKLQTELAAASLADVLSADLAQNRMVEVRGWTLPATLADLCALAAKAT